MARTATGIDVGARTAIALRGQYKGNTFHVTGFALAENDGGDPADAYQALAPTMRAQGFKPQQARVAVSGRDVNVRYMGSTPEAVEAFRAGALDWICTIEPYGTALLNDVPGSVMLSDGTDIYGKGYTDCVLAARNTLLEENRDGLKALIKGMMIAQQMAESDPATALDSLIGTYYKTSMENAKIAMTKQPAVVDARDQTDFILDRTDSLVEMGYIKNKPQRDAIDWSVLEEVIAENPELYGSLRLKAAA